MDFSGAFILGGVLLAIFGAIFLCRGKREEEILEELKIIFPLPEFTQQRLRYIHTCLGEEMERDKELPLSTPAFKGRLPRKRNFSISKKSIRSVYKMNQGNGNKEAAKPV